MAEKLQPVRGTKDLYGSDAKLFTAIMEQARAMAVLYGFEPFYTPVMEFTEVFSRTLGETSDVVNKEMYTFLDRGGESITLRPEFTAGIARAYISEGMQQLGSLKLFSTGPLFRYERPQKGRQRQFHQINYEWLGVRDPMAEVEMIALAQRLLNAFGIKTAQLSLNSLGSSESRAAYTEALVAYFSNYKNDLSEDSKTRLVKNPLRILDSKDPNDKKLLAGAPKLSGSLAEADKAYFYAVQEGIAALSIPFTVDETIVRGLDYYNDVVFEFIAHDEKAGAQNTVLAGGRYDRLISQMGGPETPALGFAAGIERLMLLAEMELVQPHTVAVLSDGEGNETKALRIAEQLRNKGRTVELYTQGSFSKRMKKADKQGATAIVVVADTITTRAQSEAGKRLAEGIEHELR